MAVKLQQQNFFSTSLSSSHSSRKGIPFFWREVVDLNHIQCQYHKTKQKASLRQSWSSSVSLNLSCSWVEYKMCFPPLRKSRRMTRFSPLASADDSIAVNGTQTSSNNDLEELRVKLDQSLQGEDTSNGLIQSLHDAARVFELAVKKQTSFLKMSWFSKAWLGVDRNAWLKKLSYQAAVYAIMQAAIEVSSRGDGRDREANVFVQRSLLRQSAPLEKLIREELSAKQPELYEWFWCEQIPMVVTTFVNYFESDTRFTAATAVCQKGALTGPGNPSDLSLLMLALSCLASITKLGPAKVSCSQFFSLIPDTIGRLMDKLVDFVPVPKAYYSMKSIGLCREFLVHFGPRAAAARVKNERDSEEIIFWVDFIQRQLRQAIDREKIWSRLTTCESIEVLEKDLAIFGFFIALGRSTQTYLSANGFGVMDEPLESFIRYLIGGSVLYYPQLSSISSYQLYVEVVCEELEWLPFYQSNLDTIKQSHDRKGKREGHPNRQSISQVLNVCSYWMQNFIMYSKWLENPTNIKAARFLSRGHNKLKECTQEFGLLMNEGNENLLSDPTGGIISPEPYSPIVGNMDSFDKALENVEEALNRLEELLQEIHLSSSNPGKEHLKAACSDLERIRKLKKEAEFLEASFRAKAASLQQGDDEAHSQTSITKKNVYFNRKIGKYSNIISGGNGTADRFMSNPKGLWSLLVRQSTKKMDFGPTSSDKNATCASTEDVNSEPNEIHRFELLKNELIELERRVQRSTDGSQNKEKDNLMDVENQAAANRLTLVQVQKEDSIVGKSIDKLKETGTNVLQGTQLLAIDVAAAMVLLRRALIGDELTVKEKKALRRTLTDLASVVPIGILMLLPVTAVGHAAMLAAIQRYVPSLIPSTYGPERLDLLRQLEKVKEMDTGDVNSDESSEPKTVV
ncbi:uncharacterized protein [Aristolochia californica]|uniref:uncharacterized protein n=1 Tax=Aristolochia californica TaxID=171875 RepID=UPI0035DE59A5